MGFAVHLFNQTATWRQASNPTEDGLVTFTETTIRCFYEASRAVYRNEFGYEYASSGTTFATATRVICAELVSEGDEMTVGGHTSPVRTVRRYPTLNGDYAYTEVLL